MQIASGSCMLFCWPITGLLVFGKQLSAQGTYLVLYGISRNFWEKQLTRSLLCCRLTSTELDRVQ